MQFGSASRAVRQRQQNDEEEGLVVRRLIVCSSLLRGSSVSAMRRCSADAQLAHAVHGKKLEFGSEVVAVKKMAFSFAVKCVCAVQKMGVLIWCSSFLFAF